MPSNAPGALTVAMLPPERLATEDRCVVDRVLAELWLTPVPDLHLSHGDRTRCHGKEFEFRSHVGSGGWVPGLLPGVCAGCRAR